jgi:hypothetical protein
LARQDVIPFSRNARRADTERGRERGGRVRQSSAAPACAGSVAAGSRQAGRRAAAAADRRRRAPCGRPDHCVTVASGGTSSSCSPPCANFVSYLRQPWVRARCLRPDLTRAGVLCESCTIDGRATTPCVRGQARGPAGGGSSPRWQQQLHPHRRRHHRYASRGGAAIAREIECPHCLHQCPQRTLLRLRQQLQLPAAQRGARDG